MLRVASFRRALHQKYRRGPHPQDLSQPGEFVLNLANMLACPYPIAADRHQQSWTALSLDVGRPLRGARAEHCEPTLMRLAHLISVRLVAHIRLTGRLCSVVRYDGRRVRLETFHRRRRCRQISPLFERLHYSRRIKPWFSVR
jgi:hypothetical protein